MQRPVVEEETSPNGAWKTEICTRDDGNLQVFLLHWTVEVVPDYGHVASFWEDVNGPAAITDSVEIARTIARELLQGCDGGE